MFRASPLLVSLKHMQDIQTSNLYPELPLTTKPSMKPMESQLNVAVVST